MIRQPPWRNNVTTDLSNSKWFEPRSISSSYCVIVWARVVLKRTVVGDWRFDNLSGSHLQSQVNNRRKWKTSFSRLFGKPRQQRTAYDSIQKTDAYWQITWRIILLPDFTQSHYYKDSDETSATSLLYTGQLTWRKQIPWTRFSQKQLQRWLC